MTRKLFSPMNPAVEVLEGRTLLSTTPSVDAIAHPTFVLAQHMGLDGRGSSPAATVGPTGITPAQIRRAYGIDAINFGNIPGDGAGQTIAIVDAFDDPNAASDLHNFDAAFGLPDPPSFRQLNQDGGANLPGADPSARPNTWELEESLDIEWARVIAPAANIVLYEANSPSFDDLVVHAVNAARNNPDVTVVSMSFGVGEFAGENVVDPLFTTPAGHQGITFLASTGDGGSPASYPAFSPNVVAVGGTTLAIDSAGNYLGETGWSGSGGGVSTQELQPTFQNSVQNTGRRTAPDIALDADPNTGVPVFDTFDNPTSAPWIQVGGTSLATPLAAGLIAIADQGLVRAGLSTLDGPSQTLPRLYAASDANFHDVISGSNGGFTAGPGYDLVTGRGSPIANVLIPTLIGSPTPAQSPPVDNTVSAAVGISNTITLRQDPNGLEDDVWVNVPTSGAPTQLIDLSQPVTINGGGLTDTLVLDASNGNPIPNTLSLNGSFNINGPLSIGAGQIVVVANTPAPGANRLTVKALTIDASGSLDLNDGAITVNYAATSPLSTIQGYLSNRLIISSTLPPGQAIADVDTGSAVQLSLRLIGDVNGDGIVDFTDLLVLARNFGASGQDWSHGALNYAGTVTFADLLALTRNFGRAATGSLVTHKGI